MPSKKLDTSRFDEVLLDISNGMSVRKACEKHGVPISTFISNVDAERYARARESLYSRKAEEMMELEEAVLGGDIDPQAYRAAMDTRKWWLARLMPKQYGDRIAQEISGPDGGPIKQEVTLPAAVEGKLNEILNVHSGD